jgi:hypothetical protein
MGTAAAALWSLTCLRWFDAGAPFRPAWLAAIPTAFVAAPALVSFALWLRVRWNVATGPSLGPARFALLLVVGLALLFRFPLAWQGALGYTSADGALSGIVAVHLRDGIDHLVFVPRVPYSGSLKSHFTALLALVLDTSRAFTLVSVLFYGLYVAALFRLALMLSPAAEAVRRLQVALAAGLYAAFSPAFVTRYSLSNDGNYVEVLALGTLAIYLAVRWPREREARGTLALLTGLSLGLALWSHILAVIYVASVVLFLAIAGRLAAVRAAPPLTAGIILGYCPGLIWNAGNHWDSFRYLVPGAPPGAGATDAPGVGAKLVGLFWEQWPVLLGYDRGYPGAWDALDRALAMLAVAVALVSVVAALRAAWKQPPGALWALLLLLGVNSTVAFLALPQLPSNPRYLLFLMTPLPILLARSFGHGWRRAVLFVLIGFGALGSLAQWPSAVRSDARWRGFVSDLERAGVEWCYTDFYLATKVNFISEEGIVCSAKLGPTTTEYFFEYREQVEAAPAAAFIAVNRTNAGKLERKLGRLGISYERRDLMKPVLLRLSRKVDPQELFPGRTFPWR